MPRAGLEPTDLVVFNAGNNQPIDFREITPRRCALKNVSALGGMAEFGFGARVGHNRIEQIPVPQPDRRRRGALAVHVRGRDKRIQPTISCMSRYLNHLPTGTNAIWGYWSEIESAEELS